MTRARFNRRLRMIYVLCGLVLIISLAAQLAKYVPGLQDEKLVRITAEIYSYMRDMALVLVTMAAAYLADVFQKRA